MLPLENQHRMPANAVRDFVLPSYVRHVARLRELQPDTDDLEIDTIRVYLVVHNILLPRQLQWGADPYDPTTYSPYYLGEFNTEGELLHPDDPLLYWLIPIIRQPKPDTPPWDTLKTNPNGFVLYDGVNLHNGGADHNLTR
jgi:hypothetical protein